MKTSFIYIQDKLVPIGITFYVVDKNTFKITEIKNNGEGNVSYNYYFNTKKEATKVSECLSIKKSLSDVICTPALREDNSLYQIHVLVNIAFRDMIEKCKQLTQGADGLGIWNKYHKT